jgi:hypothetical protein
VTGQLDIFTEAEARKAQGIAQVDANADAWWKSCADQALEHLAQSGRVFEAYDLVLMGVPEPHHPNAWGARMNAAAKRGLIRNVGAGPSKRPTVARSLVRYWQGAAT